VSAIRDAQTKDGWRLRPADLIDIDGLHALAASPLVDRYLFDGAPPDKEFITRRVAESVANAGETGLGMWFLENVPTRYAGCVELRPYPFSRSAELTYLLDPHNWGQGLALSMTLFWAVTSGATTRRSIHAGTFSASFCRLLLRTTLLCQGAMPFLCPVAYRHSMPRC
jgi:Acetyltransferase (GNAT) domain